MNSASQGRGLYVPAAFWRDHCDRMPEGERLVAQTLEWSGRRARIWATPEQLRALRDDAAFYADSESVDECPRYLRESARNTIKAIDRAVLPMVRAALAAAGGEA